IPIFIHGAEQRWGLTGTAHPPWLGLFGWARMLALGGALRKRVRSTSSDLWNQMRPMGVKRSEGLGRVGGSTGLRCPTPAVARYADHTPRCRASTSSTSATIPARITTDMFVASTRRGEIGEARRSSLPQTSGAGSRHAAAAPAGGPATPFPTLSPPPPAGAPSPPCPAPRR